MGEGGFRGCGAVEWALRLRLTLAGDALGSSPRSCIGGPAVEIEGGGRPWARSEG